MSSATAWPKGSVKDVAESLGIANLHDELSTALAADVEYRIRDLVEESLKFMRHSKRTRLSAEDVDMALKVKNIQPLWGFSSPHAPISFRKTAHPSGNLYYLEDEEIDLAKYSQAALPPIPREVSYTAHWLAVEGVQPAIPQNPSPADLRSLATSSRSSGRVAATAPEGADIKPLVAHALSKELQLYFDRLTSAAVDPTEAVRIAALESFRGDTGLQGLVAYLIQWIAERIVTSLTSSLQAVDQSIDILEALLQNQSLFIDPYLHQILPSLLSILLTSSLGTATAAQQQHGLTHISVRQHAASFLTYLLHKYSSAYAALRPRILQTLLRGLIIGSAQDGRQSGSLMGALLGIKALGIESVRQVFGARSPNLHKVGDALQRDIIPDADRDFCTTVILDALQEAYPSLSESEQFDYDELETLVGQYFAGYINMRCSPSVAVGILSEPTREKSNQPAIKDINGHYAPDRPPLQEVMSNSTDRNSEDAEDSVADDDGDEENDDSEDVDMDNVNA